MKNRSAILMLLSLSLLSSACTVWREHPGSTKWIDATGGEGLERSFWKDVQAKRWDELDHHIASKFIAVSEEGGRLDKAAALARLQQLQLDDYTLGDVHAEMNGDTFVVTYTVAMKGTFAGRPLPTEPVRMITVWQKEKSGWLAIAHSAHGPAEKR